jgi:hypothetical protein
MPSRDISRMTYHRSQRVLHTTLYHCRLERNAALVLKALHLHRKARRPSIHCQRLGTQTLLACWTWGFSHFIRGLCLCNRCFQRHRRTYGEIHLNRIRHVQLCAFATTPLPATLDSALEQTSEYLERWIRAISSYCPSTGSSAATLPSNFIDSIAMLSTR